jgi:hypothetical protein
MPSQQLAVDDRIIIKCLGSLIKCTVIECYGNDSYKLKCDSGIIYPAVEWQHNLVKGHKKPWYIVEYIGNTKAVKSNMIHNTSNDTLQKNELDKAIAAQKKFIRRATR